MVTKEKLNCISRFHPYFKISIILSEGENKRVKTYTLRGNSVIHAICNTCIYLYIFIVSRFI